jgi:hypothetical protein
MDASAMPPPTGGLPQLNFIVVISEFFGLKSPVAGRRWQRTIVYRLSPRMVESEAPNRHWARPRAIENEGFQPTKRTPQ